MSKNQTVKFSLNLENVATKGIPFALEQHQFFNLPSVDISLDNCSAEDLKILVNSYADAHVGLMALLVAVATKAITPEQLKIVLVQQGFYGNSSFN